VNRIAYLDLVGGVAGDMLLCALLDAGETRDPGMGTRILEELAHLPLAHRGARVEPVKRGGIRALLLVDPPGSEGGAGGTLESRGQASAIPELGGHSGDTRSLAEIRALLDGAGLPAAVRDLAARVFERLAAAESRVHGRPIEDVRLHEAGADDAIFDVVGVCLALDALGIDRVESSTVPMGGRGRAIEAGEGGGSLPLIPAPATAELLRGHPVSGPPPFGEATTPTGAALVTTLADRFGPPSAMRIEAIGYGAGSRDPAGVPNVVRVLIGEAAGETAGPPDALNGSELAEDATLERLVVLEANIDDLSPQLIADAAAALLEAGALDSWVTPIVMKKGRPGLVLGALSAPGSVAAVRRAFFETTTTLGVREHDVERTALSRHIDTVTVGGAPVRVKVGLLDGVVVTAMPEHDDLAALARATGPTVRSLADEALAAWRAKNPADDPGRDDASGATPPNANRPTSGDAP